MGDGGRCDHLLEGEAELAARHDDTVARACGDVLVGKGPHRLNFEARLVDGVSAFEKEVAVAIDDDGDDLAARDDEDVDGADVDVRLGRALERILAVHLERRIIHKVDADVEEQRAAVHRREADHARLDTDDLDGANLDEIVVDRLDADELEGRLDDKVEAGVEDDGGLVDGREADVSGWNAHDIHGACAAYTYTKTESGQNGILQC